MPKPVNSSMDIHGIPPWKTNGEDNFIGPWGTLNFHLNLRGLSQMVWWGGTGVGFNSTENKYYSSADHHQQKNKKTNGQVEFSTVTIKQQTKLVL